MIKRRQFIAATLSAGALAYLQADAAPTSSAAISYKFADDFDGPAGSAPDPSKWVHEIGGGGWGNGELEVYTSSRDNSFLDGNSNLVIRATKQVSTVNGRPITTYHSARLRTLGKFSTYRGNFEARIKLDVQPGLWPAWWAMGTDYTRVGWPACGEVDMVENYGNHYMETSIHTPGNTRTGTFIKYSTVTVDNQWHVWRAWWNPASGGFTFFKDGAQYMSVLPSQMPNWCFSSGVPMFMILNLAVGGTAGRPPDSVSFPVDLLVDYVRVW